MNDLINLAGKVFIFVGLITLAILLYNKESNGDANPLLVLRSNNTVVINTPIQSSSVSAAQRELMALSESLGTNDTIYLVLNSPGGSVTDGLQLIETALGLPQKVKTISMFSASMSFVISQYLSTRYVLASSTLMSHPATVGDIGGTIPGSFSQRASSVVNLINSINKQIAKRAGMQLFEYNHIIANELWMTAEEALHLKFADEIVNIKCDITLQGPGPEHTYDTLIGPVKVKWDKCPLISAPASVEFGSDQVSDTDKAKMMLLLSNRPKYVTTYGVPKGF